MASQEAARRGHEQVCTEHLIFAFLTCQSRAFNWMAAQSFPDVPSRESVPRFIEDAKKYLESLPDFEPVVARSNGEPAAKEIPLSPAMSRVMHIASQIGSAPVRDGPIVHRDGLIATEFLLASLLLEGTALLSLLLYLIVIVVVILTNRRINDSDSDHYH